MRVRRSYISVRVSAALLCLVSAATFSFAANAKSYYTNGEEGWFWYNDPIFAEEVEPEEKKEEPKEQVVIVMEAPPADEPEEVVLEEPEKGPPALSAEWFRTNLQTYIDRAVDEPTRENVEAYYLLQRVMMDKAQGFSEMAQKVVIGDPLLDEANRRSFDPSTSRLQETMSSESRKKLLNQILDKAGIAFFFTSDCQLCESQARILTYLSERVGLEVLPISLDGKPVGTHFPNTTVPDTGQAEQLGVTEGPVTFLLIPPNKWVPISYGVITQEDVISRVLSIAVDEGLVTQEQFNDTRPINITPSLADILPEDGALPEDTKDLIKFLRSLEHK